MTNTLPPKGLTSLIGTSDWSNQSSAEPLTPEKLKKAWDYLGSPEYHKIETNRYIRQQNGYTIVIAAFEQGVITENEASMLIASTGINGFLAVSSTMAKRLEKVNIEGLPLMEEKE